MLQTLLAERLKLVTHRKDEALRNYALTVGNVFPSWSNMTMAALAIALPGRNWRRPTSS
jgi:uncharacterized protein (TIGR03435 family)